jgi:hypothetical protein
MVQDFSSFYLHGNHQRSSSQLGRRDMHQIVLDNGQLHNVLGQGVDASIDTPGLRVTTQKVKWQRSTLLAKIIHIKNHSLKSNLR